MKFLDLRVLLRLAASVMTVTIVQLVCAASVTAAEYYVSPSGSSRNNGSINSPLDLATALSSSSPARPGDTIWLRGGRYRGNFTSDLVGTASQPIIVRQYPGERATIDGDTGLVTTPAITIRGSDTWFWGFEVMNSNPVRMVTGGYNPPRATSVWVLAPRTKFINLIVHDGEQGFGFFMSAVDSELYGNLIYNVGFDSDDRGHGHSIYVQNGTGIKRIVDNILLNGFSFGIHAYTQNGKLDNIQMVGNTIFNHGVVSREGPKANLYMGGGDDADYPLIDSNSLYYSPFTSGGRNIDIKPSCVNGTIRGNYSAGGTAMSIYCVTTSVTGNFFAGRTYTDISYPNNTYSSTKPTGLRVTVRPNQYERGRANITIFNWDLQRSVQVDLSGSGLPVGAAYEIRDAQDYFGAPVASGIYNGSPVTIPMTGLRVVPPIGNIPIVPTHTAPEFGAFILVPATSGTGGTTAPTATLSASPSSISAGQSALLTWSTAGATSVTIDGGIGTVPASGSASVNPSATTTYTLVASNSSGSTSKAATVTVGGGTTNQPPAVSLAVSGSTSGFTAPASVTLTATASDSDGVSSVMFYSGSTLLATDTTNTYSYMWSGVPAGTYSVTAVATDVKGATTTSTPVSVTVAPSGATSGKAAFVNVDTTTQGNWKGVYGADGYTIANDATTLPAYAKVTTNGQPWMWNKNTTEVRALQRATTGRLAAMWFGEVTILDVTISDGLTHPVAIYMLDWEGGRTQSVEVLDAATNTVLDSRTVTNFTQGQYYIWQVSGAVRFKISRLGRFNSTHSAVFFGAPGAAGGGGGDTPPASPTSSSTLATFVRTDTSTQGSWKGVYGRDGYSVALDATSLPAYARVQSTGQAYLWSRDSAELRATQRAGSGRVASMWWGEDFVLDVSITDGQAHQVALYMLDWQGGRIQSVDVLEAATNKLIGTWTVSNFTQGQYMVWQLSGNVRFRIKRLARYNGVFSGIFFN